MSGILCLDCGVVTTYVKAAALARVRDWTETTQSAKAAIDEI
jgi:hypothetical protein